MSTVTRAGVITDIGRRRLAESLGNIAGFSLTRAVYFKIGEGGYQVTPDGNIPKNPNELLHLTDIDAIDKGLYYIQKQLNPNDFTLLSPATMNIRCRLFPAEANDRGDGESPRLYEVGVFDDFDNLLFYCTYDEQTKDVTKQLTINIQVEV